MNLRRWESVLYLIVPIALASCNGAGNETVSLESYFSDVSCRYAELTAGPLDTSGIAFARNGRSLLQLMRPDPNGLAPPEIREIAMNNVMQSDHAGSDPERSRFQWTARGDLIFSTRISAQKIPAEELWAATFPSFRPVGIPVIPPQTQIPGDLAPEHTGNALLYVESGGQYPNGEVDWELVAFDIANDASGARWPLGRFVGWNDRILLAHPGGLMVMQLRKLRHWNELLVGNDNVLAAGPYALPVRVPGQIIAARERGGSQWPEMFWARQGEGGHTDAILRVEPFAPGPEILVEDAIRRIHLLPDHSGLYGYTDFNGNFRRIPGEAYSDPVSFWLDAFEDMEGLRDFRLVADSRFALVKRSREPGGVEIVLLVREEGGPRLYHRICESGSAFDSVVQVQGGTLFLPRRRVDDALLVYIPTGLPAPRLHLGSALDEEYVTSHGPDGDAMVELLMRTGRPVLVANYAGSGMLAPPGDAFASFLHGAGTHIAASISGARAILGSARQKLVVVAKDEGAFVALSSVRDGLVRPDGIVAFRPFLDGHAFFDRWGFRSYSYENYVSRPEVVRSIEPAEWPQEEPPEIMIFQGDDFRPYADVDFTPWIENYEALSPAHDAQIVTLPDNDTGRERVTHLFTHVAAFLDAL